MEQYNEPTQVIPVFSTSFERILRVLGGSSQCMVNLLDSIDLTPFFDFGKGQGTDADVKWFARVCIAGG